MRGRFNGCALHQPRAADRGLQRFLLHRQINLDAEGFRQNGDIYSSPSDKSLESCRDANKNLECYGSAVRTAGLKQLPTITGNFGMAPGGGQIIPSAEKYPYSRAMSQEK